jgi:hypothetical protein
MSQAPTFPVTCPVVFRWSPVSGWALPNGLIGVALTLGGGCRPNDRVVDGDNARYPGDPGLFEFMQLTSKGE